MLANSRNTLLRRLARGRVRCDLFVYFAIRARKYDQYARDFVQRRPGGCVVNSVWLRPALKWTIDFKLKQQPGLGQGAEYQSGIRDGHEVEQWSPGLRLLEEWSYVDDKESRLDHYLHWKLLRYTQWTLGYLLGPKDAPDVI